MKRFLVLFAILASASVVSAQSYSHNYESFFGKDDRIGLYSSEASSRFSAAVLQTIRDNTLLIDCGSRGKPSTAFVVITQAGSKIVSSAHNLSMAQIKGLDCKLGKVALPKGLASKSFKNSGMRDDAANDIAQWPNITAHEGFKVCDAVETPAKYVLIQSLDGTGRLGASPNCKVKSTQGNLITSTCKGHYKASGGPLLKVTDNDVCAAGVFNAHSGKLFGYESYAASLTP